MGKTYGYLSLKACDAGSSTVFYERMEAGIVVGEVEVNGITKDKSLVRWDDAQWFQVGRYLRRGRPGQNISRTMDQPLTEYHRPDRGPWDD